MALLLLLLTVVHTLDTGASLSPEQQQQLAFSYI